MICVQPVMDAFRERWGRAPKLPDEVDAPEMLAVRRELLAGFVGRLHALLGTRRMVFSCIAEVDNDYYRRMGLDLEMLVARGLVESVYVTGFCPRSDFWKQLRDSGKTRVYSSVHCDHSEGTAAPDPYDHRWQAGALKAVLDAGFAGAFFWDTDAMHHNPYNWHVFRHGGNREFLERALKDDPAIAPVFRKITSIQGVRCDRYNPMRSY